MFDATCCHCKIQNILTIILIIQYTINESGGKDVPISDSFNDFVKFKLFSFK